MESEEAQVRGRSRAGAGRDLGLFAVLLAVIFHIPVAAMQRRELLLAVACALSHGGGSRVQAAGRSGGERRAAATRSWKGCGGRSAARTLATGWSDAGSRHAAPGQHGARCGRVAVNSLRVCEHSQRLSPGTKASFHMPFGKKKTTFPANATSRRRMERSHPLMPGMAPLAGRTRRDTTRLVAGLAAGTVMATAIVGMLNARAGPHSTLQIIPVMDSPMLGDWNGHEGWGESVDYQRQEEPRPFGTMGTNTAFLGSHDGAHVGWPARRLQQGIGVLHKARRGQLQLVPMSALKYDTWVPNAEAASDFYPSAGAKNPIGSMGTNNAFIGSSDGAHTGWQDARAPATDKSLTQLGAALSQQMRYVSTGQGNGEAKAIFDDVGGGEHGSNNRHLAAKKSRKLEHRSLTRQAPK